MRCVCRYGVGCGGGMGYGGMELEVKLVVELEVNLVVSYDDDGWSGWWW